MDSSLDVRVVQIDVRPDGIYALDQEGRIWYTHDTMEGSTPLHWVRVPSPQVAKPRHLTICGEELEGTGVCQRNGDHGGAHTYVRTTL